MRLARAAFLSVVLVGCTYDEHDLPCDSVSVGCGGGESCVVRDTGVPICSCGDVNSAARACASGTSCSSGACVVNLPPSAVIAHAEGGVLRVASNSSAVLTGRDSTDPEGGSLTYAWDFSGACGTPPAALDTRDITLATVGITDACTVSLTVRDDFGEAAVSTARIVVRAVGAYVATKTQEPDCVEAYDSAREEPQGTYDHPFCDLAPAMTAAADNSLPEVSIAIDAVLTVTESVVVSDLAVVGGYTRSSDGPWVVDNTQTSKITTSLDLGGQPLVRLSGGSTALRNLTLVATTTCTGGCTTVEVTGTSATMMRVSINADTASTDNLTAIAVHEGDEPTALTISDGTVLASNGRLVVGLDVAGAVEVTLDTSTTIRVSNSASVGIAARLHAGSSFTMHNASLLADGTGSGVAFGLKDGAVGFDVGTVAIASDGACPDASACKASAHIVLDASVITASSAGAVAGVVLLGSPDVTLKNGTTITGQKSGNLVGLLTRDVTGLNATQTAVSVTGINGGSTDSVIAYRDGYSPAAGSFTNGSQGIVFGEGTSLTARVESLGIESVNGILLMGTSNALFKTTKFAVAGAASDIAALSNSGAQSNSVMSAAPQVNVQRAAAAETHATNSVHFESCMFDVSGVVATQRVNAFADGCGSATNAAEDTCNEVIAGSSALTLTGNFFRADMKGAAGGNVRRICALLAGTSNAMVTQNNFLCSTERGVMDNELNLGLWLLATSEAHVEQNNVAMAPLPSTRATKVWIVGVLDGSYPTFDNIPSADFDNAASTALTMNRNSIALRDGDTAYAVGVWYRGATGRPVYNSLIDLRTPHNYGVVLEKTAGDVKLNTIRSFNCKDGQCSGFGVGVYVLLGAEHPSSIIGNVFTAEAVATAHGNLAVVNHRATSATIGGIGALSYNTFGRSGTLVDQGIPGTTPNFYAAVTDANSYPGNPTSANTATYTDDRAEILGTMQPGTHLDENQPDDPSFCDNLGSVLNSGAGVSLVPTSLLDPNLFAADYNGAQRDSSSGNYDAGATERFFLTCEIVTAQ